MKTAFIYKRVSSDDQVKGYSLSDQDARLIQYCSKEEIQIIGSYSDDGISAKTFDREGYIRMRKDAKTLKPDFILFINWKRFSRNLEQALTEIRKFREAGITPQAIDQRIDYSQTGYKYMLNIYLTEAEVDNDQRSESVIRGMLRAMKEGRNVNTAPRGYLHKKDEKIIIVDPIKAPLVKEMFDLMATGLYTMEHVRKKMWAKGLKFGRSNFKSALENFKYIGKIKIKPYKDEPEQLVKGIHEAIIDESIFYRVQDIISGKKPRKQPTRLNEELPLRGFLFCTQDHKMTGSCSHGHGGSYYYYHCANQSCERHRAIHANKAYEDFLQSIKVHEDFIDVISQTVEYLAKPDQTKTASLQHQIKQQEQRIEILHDRYIDGHIQLSDYKQIKGRYETNLFELKNQLSEITNTQSANYYTDSIKLLKNLPELYSSAAIEKKRSIIGSITPGKLYFENKKVRTSEINHFILLISSMSNKNTLQKIHSSSDVVFGWPNGASVRTFQDAKILSDLIKELAA